MASKKQTRYNKIQLILLYLSLSGKDEIIGRCESSNNLPTERILITKNGITRMYKSAMEDREWKWDECSNQDIDITLESIDMQIKKFFGLLNCNYVNYYNDWTKM